MAGSGQPKYIQKKLIGTGGFGYVWDGYDTKNKKNVVLKHIFDSTSDIKQEIQMLTQLQNTPGVVKFIEYFNLGTSGFIVMEKVEHVIDLFDYISKNKTIVESTSKIIFVQLLDILTWCKKAHVFHGDIKDENILIDPNSLQITLIDFGSATSWNKNYLFQNNGTKLCSPPEWFSEHFFTADNFTVWSLGILLYTMLFGNIPFLSRDEIINKQISIQNQIMSETCAIFLTKCLEKKVQKRPRFDSLKFQPWIMSTIPV